MRWRGSAGSAGAAPQGHGSIRSIASTARRRRRERRDDDKQHSGAGAAHSPHARELRSAVRSQRPLREMADRLAAERVSRLDPERVERPEILLGRAKQRAPAEPARKRHAEQHQRGANSGQFEDADKRRRQPRRSRSAALRPRSPPAARSRRSRRAELRQADLGEKAAGDRQKRLLLRARGVVLGVAVARIEDRPCWIGRAALEARTWALEEMTSGARMGLAANFPETIRAPSMARVRTIARPAPNDRPPIHRRFKRGVDNRRVRRIHHVSQARLVSRPRGGRLIALARPSRQGRAWRWRARAAAALAADFAGRKGAVRLGRPELLLVQFSLAGPGLVLVRLCVAARIRLGRGRRMAWLAPPPVRRPPPAPVPTSIARRPSSAAASPPPGPREAARPIARPRRPRGPRRTVPAAPNANR